MKYILLFIFTIVTIFTNAQQVNPVTDYTFANKMSAGRNTVTDTAAYFSVGPRFGAIRGMMPPIVVDTAVVNATRRNGLLIFSVQKNKMQVWDSAGSKWADLTGTSGTAITSADTASMLAPYLRWADTVAMLLPYLRWADTTAMLAPYLLKSDTTAMLLPYLRVADTTAMLSPYLKESDTVWLSNRIDLKVNISDTATMLDPYLRGSGTANYLPIFDATRSVINSKVYQTGNNLLFNTTTPSFITSGLSAIENNATGAAVYSFKRADTLRAYMSMGSTNTFDINNLMAGDIRFYTQAQLRGRFQTDGTFRLNSLTGSGSRIVVADADGVLSATSSATGLVDTTVVSTRDWRQKGDDSLGAIIATKGSGTVTSVATGYGLSGGTITTAGTIIADSAIVASRLRVGKVVDSLSLVKQNVLTNPVTGTGTTNYVPKFTGTSTIGSSTIFDDGEVKINTTSDAGAYVFQANGAIYNNADAVLAFSSGNVNIGTATNLAKLTIRTGGVGAETNGIGMSNGAQAHFWYLEDNTTTRFNIGSGAGVYKWSNSNGVLAQLSSNAELLLNTTTDQGDYKLQVSGSGYISNNLILPSGSSKIGIGTTSPLSFLHVGGGSQSATNGAATKAEIRDGNAGGRAALLTLATSSGSTVVEGQFEADAGGADLRVIIGSSTNHPAVFRTNNTERLRITAAGELLLNTTTDAGDYKLQVSGNAYVTGTTVLAATTGRVGIATTTPGANSVLDVNGNLFIRDTARINFRNSQTNLGSYTIGYSSTSPRFPIRLVLSEDPTNQRYFEVGHYTGDNIANTWNPQVLMNAWNGSVSLGSGTAPVASAQLEVASTTKGFLPPRMTTTQRDAISSPAAGLVIYNTTTSKLQVYTTAWTDLH